MSVTRLGADTGVILPRPALVDRHGRAWRKADIDVLAMQLINAENYFHKKAKHMLADTEKAIAKTAQVSAEFSAVIDRFVATENRLADESKRVAGSVKASAERMGQGIDRLQKSADFERLERYVALLERAAVAMQTLAELEASGRLEKIAAAIR